MKRFLIAVLLALVASTANAQCTATQCGLGLFSRLTDCNANASVCTSDAGRLRTRRLPRFRLVRPLSMLVRNLGNG